MSFHFVSVPHPSAIRLSDAGSRAVRDGTAGSGAIVYLDQPLLVGNELVLYVEQSSDPTASSVSLTLGMTTCCVRKVQKYACHAASLCHKTAPCEGQSTRLPLKRCSRPGARISVKRVLNHSQITVCVGSWCGTMAGMNFKSIGTLFPFLMLTGDVSAIRIGSESSRQTLLSANLTPALADNADEAGYAFLIPPRADRHEAGKMRTTLRGSVHGVAGRMIFLSRELSAGWPLLLRVTEKRSSEKDFGFIFGVTTCDRTKFGTKYLHNFVYSDPATCEGHSKYCKIPDMPLSDCVTIERTDSQFIRFTIGEMAYSLQDPDSFFNDKKTFPFVMISGTVFALDIIGDSAYIPPANEPFTPAECGKAEHQPALGQDDPNGYAFLIAQDNRSIEKPRKVASSIMHGVRMKMTFLNKEIEIGKPLIVRVTRKKVEQEISFTFGVTTCDRTARNLPFAHPFNFQRPSTCRGHEVHCEIPSQPLNALVAFERTEENFIRIKTERESYFLKDKSGVFRNKKAFPYVMVNGSAYTLAIVDEDEAPPDFLPKNIPKFLISESVINNGKENGGHVHASTAPTSAVSRHSNGDHAHPAQAAHAKAPALPTTSKSSNRKWYSNVTVTYKDSKLFRFGDAHSNCSIFSDRFATGDSISFTVSEIDTRFCGSMSFGVTQVPIVLVDIDALPTQSNDSWFISSDILPVIRCGEEIRIQRTDSDVTMQVGDEGETSLFALPSGIKVYPFFRFDGAVRAVNVIDKSSREE